MGVPMLVALAGPQAAGAGDLRGAGGPVRHQLGLHRAGAGARRLGPRRAHRGAAGAARRALSNPLPWSIALGAAFSAAGIKLGRPVRGHRQDAGRCRIAGGAVHHRRGAVARSGQHAHTRTPAALYWPRGADQEPAAPAADLRAGGRRARAGRSAGRARRWACWCWRRRCPRPAACRSWPNASAPTTGRIARIIMSSTVLAFATFSATAWLVGVKP